MTARRAVVLVLAAALSAPLFAAPVPKESAAYGYYARKVMVPVWDDLLSRQVTYEITAGVSREIVQSWLGSPIAMLTPNMWVYDSCRPNYSTAQGKGCTLLVISFDGQQVTELKFVNAAMVANIAANLRANALATYTVDK